MKQRLLRVGLEIEYDHEPPLSWFRQWEKQRIEIPPLTKYRGIATISSGVHIVCGTLHNQSFRQFQSVDFRTIRIDEVFNCTLSAIRTIIACCRCGGTSFDDIDLALDELFDWLEDASLNASLVERGGTEAEEDEEDDGAAGCGHLHDVTLSGNPPLGPHWIFDWLDQRESAAKKHYVGPAVDHRNWELLRAGVGRTIIIRSSTRDNLKNVGYSYLEGLEDDFSSDVAARLIDGELIREAAGRAFTEFSSGNVSEVEYDPDQLIYAWLDFDLRPRAAVFAHRLERGEYPEQGPRDSGVVHYGIFGEFFSEMPMSNRDFIEALISGRRGVGGDAQYEDARLRGLPENWQGLKAHRGQIIFSGDAQGKDASRHADDLASDWKMVRQVLNAQLRVEEDEGVWSIQVAKKNPHPAVGIHTLNGKFRNAAGVRSIHIDPKAKHLLKDAETCEWDEVGHDLRHCGAGFGGTLWMRTHEIKALIYGVFPLSPYSIDTDPDDEIPTGRLPKRRKVESFMQ